MWSLKKSFWLSGLTASFLLLLSSTSQADSLRYVIEHTIHNNPEVMITDTQLFQNQQEIKIARAPFFPTIDLFGDAGEERAKNNNTLFQTTILTRRQADLSLDENVFRGFTDFYNVKQQKARTRSTGYRINNTMQTVSLEVAEAYLNVLRERELVAIARKNVDAHLKTFKIIKKRGETGLGRRADTVQAQGRLALARSNLLTAKNNYLDAIATYIRVVGEPPRNLIKPMVPENTIPPTLNAALLYALDYNPSLHSAHANLEARNYERLSAIGPFYPHFDIVLNSQRGADLNGVKGVNQDDFGVLELAYNLYRGGADLARLRQVAYQKQEAFEDIRNIQRQVGESVRLSWNALQTTIQQIPQLLIHKVKSRETVVAFREQFTIGKRTLVDLLNAENEYFNASRAYTDGVYDLLLNKYRLLTSMGKLFYALHIPFPHTAIQVALSEPLHPLPNKYIPFTHPHHVGPNGSRNWAVQMGAYLRPSRAITYVKSIRALGYPAYIYVSNNADKLVYNVFAGPFPTHDFAEHVLPVLNRHYALQGYIVSVGTLKPVSDRTAM